MRFLIIAGLAGSLTGFRKPLIQALLDKGVIVHAAAPQLNSEEQATKELESLGVITHDIPLARTGLNPIQDIRTAFSFWRLMRVVRPDQVLGYTIKPVVYGLLAARLAGVHKRYALITGLGYAFQESLQPKRKLINKVSRTLYKLALKGCQAVFFQNPDDQALFSIKGIVSPSVASYVVNGSGVDLAEYSYSNVPRRRYPTFLFVGRLLGDKGVREYASASAIIQSRYPQVKFGLVGRIDVNPNSISQSELDEWISDERLTYYGQQKDVKPFIADCSVFVLPSYREGTPRTVLEAMSMGRAIITTDAPGCRETVVHGVNGFLVPVKNIDALVMAMSHFIENPDSIDIMGVKAREVAEVKYDVHKVNQKMLEGMGV